MDSQPIIDALWEIHKTNIALKIIDDYFARFYTLAQAYGALDPSIVPIENLNNNHKDMQNHVIFIGDWMETVAYLYTSGFANTKLLDDLNIPGTIERFRAELEKGQKDSPFLETMLSRWNHLRNFQVSQEA